MNLISKDATDKSLSKSTIASLVSCFVASPLTVSFSILSLNSNDKNTTPNSGSSASCPPNAFISLIKELKFLFVRVA